MEASSDWLFVMLTEEPDAVSDLGKSKTGCIISYNAIHRSLLGSGRQAREFSFAVFIMVQEGQRFSF
jgi:hypothetical protein